MDNANDDNSVILDVIVGNASNDNRFNNENISENSKASNYFSDDKDGQGQQQVIIRQWSFDQRKDTI